MLSTTNNPEQPSRPPQFRDKHVICPSCGQRTVFRFAGEQHWPAEITQVAGIDPVIRLWHCGGCHTTLSV
jgi:ribosomal protein S27AE